MGLSTLLAITSTTFFLSVPQITTECKPYYYAPVSDAIEAGKFPGVWNLANILAKDNDARVKYQSIQPKIPNIVPKGYQPRSINGDWSGFNYPDDDPDCWWTYTRCTTPAIAGLPTDITTVPPNILGYSFDDGPNCSHNAFYDFLLQKHQKATMFYIGSNVADLPHEAARGHTDGHEICVRKHLVSPLHDRPHKRGGFCRDLLYRGMEIIKLTVGITPTCWRPPFGDVDDRIRAIAHALGLHTILWSFETNDWQAGIGGFTAADVDSNYESLIARAHNGSFSTCGPVILAHELRTFTMSEAMKFYDRLKAAFHAVLPIGAATNEFRSRCFVDTNNMPDTMVL